MLTILASPEARVTKENVAKAEAKIQHLNKTQNPETTDPAPGVAVDTVADADEVVA